jgi:LmbE family N-acetylglucosaminyl deacetylase
MNLIISAHPDDEILGCGGVIAKEDSSVLILTNGADGRLDKATIDRHLENAKKANELIGTKELIIESFPNQKLDSLELTQIVQTIEKYIQKIKPKRVFTHSLKDLNLDHKIVAQATITATRSLPCSNIEEVLSYYVPSSSEWQFTESFSPNYFISIDIEEKLEAMKVYDTELREYPHPRSLRGIKVVSEFFGIQAGCKAAEAFELIRKVER